MQTCTSNKPIVNDVPGNRPLCVMEIDHCKNKKHEKSYIKLDIYLIMSDEPEDGRETVDVGLPVLTAQLVNRPRQPLIHPTQCTVYSIHYTVRQDS